MPVLSINSIQPSTPGSLAQNSRNPNLGPAYADWDFAALKNFEVRESMQIQFRAELFNIMNRPTFGCPTATSVRRRSTISLQRTLRAKCYLR